MSVDVFEHIPEDELADADRIFEQHKWTFSAGRSNGLAWLKLGPVTLAVYRYLDERWRVSLCAFNRERFVWPSL